MYRIQTLNKISKTGLATLPNESYDVGDDVDDPDALLVRSADLHAVEFGDNLKAIARRASDSGAGVVLLGIRIPTNYGARYTSAFEAVYPAVAEEQGILWIEFFMEGVALNDELLQADRIHPNEKAQPILLDNAWPIIRATLDGE